MFFVLLLQKGRLYMNEKFFDLKKEKQDRIINGALKVISLNGYTHASTDEIVKEAAISKGLLFHYFENKIGMLEFIYNYSIRYALLELRSALKEPSPDFFVMQQQLLDAEVSMLYQYPNIQMFLERLQREHTPEVESIIREGNRNLIEYYDSLCDNVSGPDKVISSGRRELFMSVFCTKLAVQRYLMMEGTFTPEYYKSRIETYILALRKLAY